MDLFDYMRESKKDSEGPLASRLRPRTLDEVVGQEHILGRDKLLTQLLQTTLSSICCFAFFALI